MMIPKMIPKGKKTTTSDHYPSWRDTETLQQSHRKSNPAIYKKTILPWSSAIHHINSLKLNALLALLGNPIPGYFTLESRKLHSHRNLSTTVCSSCLHNCPYLEMIQMSFNRWMDAQTGVHPYNGMLNSAITSNNLDESQRHLKGILSESVPKRLYTVRFNVYSSFKGTKPRSWRTELRDTMREFFVAMELFCVLWWWWWLYIYPYTH